jgi:vanillate O-demethylase monooxygenase subunit
MNAVLQPRSDAAAAATPAFPMNRWWVAGFSWELKDQPLGRTLLGHPVVLFRTPDGRVSALEDRCSHKELPLSLGTLEEGGLRCGYHGLLFEPGGRCIEIPGQERIPAKTTLRSFPLVEQDQILWIWVGASAKDRPTDAPPAYRFHSDPAYQFGGNSVHYDVPWQLIHDNLLDLSHLGYVHLKTVGGNPKLHMNAPMKVEGEGRALRVVRHMPNSVAPPTYQAAWPWQTDRIDRWQEIDFKVSHLHIWTGAMEPGSGDYADVNRHGFHMHGFHGVTPETETTAHYFWTIATNPHPDMQNVTQLVVDQTEATFMEDKVVLEAQWRNQHRFAERKQVDIHVDVGPNRARRIVRELMQPPRG